MAWDGEQPRRAWQSALMTALTDAIAHLRAVIFDERWDEFRAVTGSGEDALRESVTTYERELARLFAVIRVSGALPDAVAWSTLKTDFRRAALDANTEISLRTALESGFYAAEPVALGDHAAYLRWAAALRGFLAASVPAGTRRPDPDATEDERLQWAYNVLAPLEDHDTFNRAFIGWIATNLADRPEAAGIAELQARLLAHPRYDLVLNAGLRWLAASLPA